MLEVEPGRGISAAKVLSRRVCTMLGIRQKTFRAGNGPYTLSSWPCWILIFGRSRTGIALHPSTSSPDLNVPVVFRFRLQLIPAWSPDEHGRGGLSPFIERGRH